MSAEYENWTNYATWRINLEIFRDQNLEDLGMKHLDEYDLAHAIKKYTEELLEAYGATGIALDYALAFISEVRWHEIARNLIENEENKDCNDEHC